MVGWHYHFNGHEFEQAPGDGEGQESLACCSPWGHKESNMTEQQSVMVVIAKICARVKTHGPTHKHTHIHKDF